MPLLGKLSIQLRDDIHAFVNDAVTGRGDGLLMIRNHYP